MADGWITIGTKLSTDKFDKDLAKLDTKINRAEKTKEVKLNAKVVAEDNLKQQKQATFELEKQYESASKELERLQNLQARRQAGGNLTPQQFTDLGNLSAVSKQEATLGSQLDRAYATQQRLKAKVESTTLAYQKSADAVIDLKSKAESINLKKQQADVEKIKSGFNSVGSAVQNATRTIGRMILGVFGIRTAVMALRSASSTLSQYDSQYASNLEYIRFVLAQMIAPVLKWIINLAGTLLNYLYAILNAWFGIGKKTDVSAKNFKKMKTGAVGTAKASKEIQNSLAGFDEMNTLQDNSDKGNSGGFTAPSFDIGQGQEVPKWLQWLLDHGDVVKKIIKGIGIAIAGIKIADFLKKLGLLGEGISGFKKLILGLGIGIIIKGVVDTVKAIIEFVKDPSWENFAEILKGLSEILLGISIVLMVIKGFNPVTWIVLAIAAITLLVAEIIKHWDEIKEVLGKVGDWINDHIIQPVKNFFVGLWNDITTGVKKAWNDVVSEVQGVASWIYDNIIQPIINFFVSLWNDISTGVKNGWNGIVSFIASIPSWLNNNIIQPIINFFVNLWNNIRTGVSNLWNSVVGIIQGIANWVYSRIIQPIISFFNNMWNNIRGGLSNIGNFFSNIFNGMRNIAINVINAVIGVFHSLSNAVSNVMNGIWNIIRGIINSITGGINTLIRGLNKISFNTPNWVPGIGGKHFGINIPQIPRLKTGGIVNIPNRGINIGGAIAGESGREGVLPLTDTQAMQLLGQEIGKYITINANITNTMNGRVIARQLQQIKADNDFAYNT